MSIFARRDVDAFADSLGDYLPGGVLFASKQKSASNLRKLLRGLSGELFDTNGYLKAFSDEFIPDATERFISEWESALGIPDGCFKGDGTLSERRLDVLVKLASMSAQTAQDFIDLAAIYGATATISSGFDEVAFPLTFPIPMIESDLEARFTLIISIDAASGEFSFPYTFPLLFENGIFELLRCIFERIKPADVTLIMRQA